MSRLDDDQLTEHLSRRAAGSATAGELARGIEQAMAGVRQERARPWDRWAGLPVPGRAVGVPAVSAALVLVLVAVAVNLGRPQGGEQRPSGTPTGPISTWLLSLDQLEQVLDRIDGGEASGTTVGKVIVARVGITRVYPFFPGVHPAVSPALGGGFCEVEAFSPQTTCPSHYAIAGSDPPITVAGVPDTAPCPTGRCDIALTSGPFALGLHAGHVVQYVSPVRLRGDAGVPWSVDDFIDSSSTEPMVVDGWLSGIPPLPCPLDPRPSTRFECGPASWVTASPFDASVTPAPSSDGAYTFAAPARGIRAQNAASSIVRSSTGLAGDATSVPGPRRGLFLLNRVDVDPATCFLCSSVTAFLAAEVEPVEVGPPATAPSPSAPEPSPTATAADQGSSWFTDESALAGAVRAASEVGGSGRVVIADVSFERAGDCGEPIDPNLCHLIVSDSDPPIQVRDTFGDCMGPFFCPAELIPVVPSGGPYALRILADGSLSFVGYLGTRDETSPGSSVAWDVDAMRSHLAALSGSQLSDYRLFVVTGWISAAAGSPKCLYIGTDGRFGCGQAAWLTADPVRPNAFPSDGWSFTTPRSSIRLQNGVVPPSTMAQLIVGDEQARLGTFLVRAVLPPPSCIFCDGPVAELVAWLDPPKGLVATEPATQPSDGPSAAPSLSAEAQYALSYAQKFEHERAIGDFEEAWLLLGPATKADYGSYAKFFQFMTAYNQAGGAAYELSPPTQDPAVLNEQGSGSAVAEAVPSTAWYVAVSHPNVVPASEGPETLLVGSGLDGNWHIWFVRWAGKVWP